ncbi:CapA family protein [Nocardioides sp. MAHUQ-72]|uniref:CapA family protein n=1 Tax=unclassified Nocardioides TaxID=2615069 RepID=UPI0036226708
MARSGDRMTIVLCGDVMLGRGVDQVLAHPGDPRLQEASVRNARRYVELAEAVSGPVPAPVEDAWPWGDALGEMLDPGVAVRVVNLETAITRSSDFAPHKAVNYRMSPANVGCLRLARPDACVLANNHTLDFGPRGLVETLDVLRSAGLTPVGAGADLTQAGAPAIVGVNGGRVAVLAFGHGSSGVPAAWAATPDRPGLAVLPDLSGATADAVAERVRREKDRGAVVVVSLHWGSNWGHAVPSEQVRFAHRLVDAGADIVHGHSSHHPRPVEVHGGRLILYGCGDLVNDYEGISGHEEYRGDLRLLFRVTVDRRGALDSLALLPFRSRRLRLERAGPADVAWLARTLDRASGAHRTRLQVAGDRIELGRR